MTNLEQFNQGIKGENDVVSLAQEQGEILIQTSQSENYQGADFINNFGHKIDVKTYGYLLILQYNKEKNWCSIPNPFNIDSISTHIYTLLPGQILKRYTKLQYFKKFFKEDIDIDSLRKLAKNYIGRCTESEYLKRKNILETILKNYIKQEFRLDDFSKNDKWNKLKVV